MALVLAKWRRGLSSSLETKDIENGNIYLSTDNGQLHIDIDDERIEVTDFVKETEEEILSTLSPLPKFYYATDTYRLWYYDTTDNEWHSLEVQTAEQAVADSEGNVITVTYATNEAVNNEITRLEEMIGDLVGFSAEVVDELPSEGENGVIYLVPQEEVGDNNYYDEYIWVEVDSSFEKIGSTEINLSNYVTTDGKQDLTNKTYEGYTLNNAVEYDVTDNTTPTAVEDSDNNLVTGETVYNTLPKVNNSHDYTANDGYYAAEEAGENGQILSSVGGDTPEWINQSEITAGAATADSEGNVINETYATKEELDDSKVSAEYYDDTKTLHVFFRAG